MRRSGSLGAAAGLGVLWIWGTAQAAVVEFFDPAQPYSVTAGVTSDTYTSHGYIFACTRDKLFTGGTGTPIGRAVRVPWPQGAEAQAVTTPPPGSSDYKARVIVQRVDGEVFDLTAFTAMLLANTYGAGAAIEVMPLLDGEDGLPDPVAFSATGFAGMSFSYDESTPSYIGSTMPLKGFDTYRISLYVDFALTALTLEGAAVGDPGDADLSGRIDIEDYFRIDLGYAGRLTGFANGDFDYSGAIDGADYLIIDRAFLAQMSISPAASSPVPEPVGDVLLGASALGLLRRRRRCRQ
jgi:hypothetical protein